MRDIILEINEKLNEIEKEEGVRILHAVESGSRAWGFASPDSDYDVRFVYVRKKEDYLRLDEPKDTIDWQLDEVLDINGWDLKKALKQFAKGNHINVSLISGIPKELGEYDDGYRPQITDTISITVTINNKRYTGKLSASK